MKSRRFPVYAVGSDGNNDVWVKRCAGTTRIPRNTVALFDSISAAHCALCVATALPGKIMRCDLEILFSGVQRFLKRRRHDAR